MITVHHYESYILLCQHNRHVWVKSPGSTGYDFLRAVLYQEHTLLRFFMLWLDSTWLPHSGVGMRCREHVSGWANESGRRCLMSRFLNRAVSFLDRIQCTLGNNPERLYQKDRLVAPSCHTIPGWHQASSSWFITRLKSDWVRDPGSKGFTFALMSQWNSGIERAGSNSKFVRWPFCTLSRKKNTNADQSSLFGNAAFLALRMRALRCLKGWLSDVIIIQTQLNWLLFFCILKLPIKCSTTISLLWIGSSGYVRTSSIWLIWIFVFFLSPCRKLVSCFLACVWHNIMFL